MLGLTKSGNGTFVNSLFCEFPYSCGGTERLLRMCDCIHYRLELFFPVVARRCLWPRKYLDRAKSRMSRCLRRKSRPRIMGTISFPTTTKGCLICLSLRFTNMDTWLTTGMCSPAGEMRCILLGVILRCCGTRFSTSS